MVGRSGLIEFSGGCDLARVPPLRGPAHTERAQEKGRPTPVGMTAKNLARSARLLRDKSNPGMADCAPWFITFTFLRALGVCSIPVLRTTWSDAWRNTGRNFVRSQKRMKLLGWFISRRSEMFVTRSVGKDK